MTNTLNKLIIIIKGELKMKKEMSDVPANVCNDVRAKWRMALKTGWRDSLWTRCAMCKFMGPPGEASCDDCPLYADVWCTGKATTSRTSIKYHENKIIRSKIFMGAIVPMIVIKYLNKLHYMVFDRSLFREEAHESWHNEIKAFLAYIQPCCEDEVYGGE